MPTKNPDLHGSAPDKSGMALLLIDVINDLEFPEAEQMLGAAVKMARQLARLKKRAHRAGVPAIYVNDNFGKWKSDFRATIEHCAQKNVRGREIVEMLKPADAGLFRPETETFRILLDQPGDAAALSRIEHSDPHWNRR